MGFPGFGNQVGCDDRTLWKWYESAYSMPPYQFKDQNLVAYTVRRPPNADEREDAWISGRIHEGHPRQPRQSLAPSRAWRR